MVLDGAWLSDDVALGKDVLAQFSSLPGTVTQLKVRDFREAVKYPNQTIDFGPIFWHSGISARPLPTPMLSQWIELVSESKSLSIGLEALGGAVADVSPEAT